MSLKPIKTIDDVKDYLYAGMQLEHATIPTYITTMYSIHPDTNLEAYNLIRVIVIEEMLHLTLAANILNAIGGTPDMMKEGFLPEFPTYLPNGETDFEVSLAPFSHSTVDMFLEIERPAKPEEEHTGVRLKSVNPGQKRYLLPCLKDENDQDVSYYSIGDFYKAIEEGLETLCDELGEENVFVGDKSRQVTPEYYYSGGGDIVPVYDLDSAKQAIRLISEQGEGFEGGIFDYEGELAHYYRFQQLKLGKYYHKGDKADEPTGEALKVDWEAVYPIKTNAKMEDYPKDSELYAANLKFNQYYKNFMDKINTAFNGKPETLIPAIGGMFIIKQMAYEIIKNPVPGSEGMNATPTFEVDKVELLTDEELNVVTPQHG